MAALDVGTYAEHHDDSVTFSEVLPGPLANDALLGVSLGWDPEACWPSSLLP